MNEVHVEMPQIQQILPIYYTGSRKVDALGVSVTTRSHGNRDDAAAA